VGAILLPGLAAIMGHQEGLPKDPPIPRRREPQMGGHVARIVPEEGARLPSAPTIAGLLDR
jgi:hypothetical protein